MVSGVEPVGGFGAAFQSAFDTVLARRRAERSQGLEDLGSQVVARLALAPVWTDEVLDASGLAEPGTLDRLAAFGVAERHGDRFVVAEERVSDAIGPVLRSGAEAVAEDLRIIADGVSQARRQPEVEIPATLDRFATLTAGAHSAVDVANRLIKKVTEALDIADAVNWIDAAAGLEAVMGREIVGARLRAGRVVAGRRRDDDLSQFLLGYFPRPALEATLLAVRDGGPADPWAVHLRAPAGRGKTMLVRWLDTRFPSDGSAGSVVRVDFDYLRPTYPGTEPGLLLTLLAAQLRQFATTEALVRFDRFDGLVADWHARIDEAERTRPAEVEGIRAERNDLVFDAFTKAVGQLPAPVVLILDTTEELHKARGGDANVRSTIAMLRALHEDVPAVRVVLSGRRGLPLPPGADELPVPSFDRDEAARFVAWVGVDDTRASAVVERVAQDQSTSGFNPFDLARLARWARDDPEFGPEMIRTADDDQYVEQRIVGRLAAPELRDMLPVVVALARFDVPTLGAATGLEGEALDRLAASVGSQEWITTEVGGVLALDPQLAARLATYLQRHRRAAWDAARLRAGDQLRGHCLEVPRTAITVEHVAGAIRLTDALANRAGAEDWWSHFEDRARADAAYSWLLTITSRLLATNGAVPSGHPLRGAVTASQAACLDQEYPDPPLGREELWRQAYELAEPGSRLAARTAARLPDRLPETLARWAEALDEALAGSFVAGAEAWAALGPATAESLWDAVRALPASPELVAMAAVLVGRAHGRTGNSAACRPWLDKALELVEGSVGPQAGNEWIDWPVEDVGSRVRLWAARIWWPALGSATEAVDLLGVPGPAENTDQERAAALAGMLALARGGSRLAVRAPAPSFPARCALHLDVPPLAVPRALALARMGDVDGAATLLEDLTRRHGGGGPDYLAAERTLMLLVRRFRLRDVGIGLTSGLLDSSEIADRSLLADLDAHDGDKVTVPPWQDATVSSEPDLLHLSWRAVRAGDPAALDAARGWPFVARSDAAEGSAVEMHRMWDTWELALMTGTAAPPRADVAAWARAHPREPEAALRLHLRAAALTGPDGVGDDEPATLVARLGTNQAAEIALDEGESLALRLPLHARRVLDRAARWFAQAQDPGGALRASTLAVLAAPATDRAPADLDDVAQRYRDLASEAGLPPWNQLRDRPDVGLAVSPRGWQPWVARVAVLLVVASGRRDDALLAELRLRLGSTGADNQVVLPAELTSALTPSSPRQVPSPAASAPGTPPAVTLQIEGAHFGTHIDRGTTARVGVRSAKGRGFGDVVLDTDPMLPYAARRQLGSPLTSLLADLDPGVPLELHHAADLAAVPWEAIVTAALVGAVGHADEPPPTMWRRLQKARRRRLRRSPEWAVLRVSSDPVFAATRPRTVTVERAADLDAAAAMVGRSARVVHLVGWANETRSGVGFAVDRPGARTSASPPRTANDLSGWFPTAELVIVQGLPDVEPVLGDWSREQGAYLRQVGADFALDGVPAVIVIPPCRVGVTQIVIDAIAVDSSEQLSQTRLLQAVDELRRTIRDVGPSERVAEDALGVCLFLSDVLTVVHDPDAQPH